MLTNSSVSSSPSLSASRQNDLVLQAEHNLMAPCCYTQTIDVHMSEIAGVMRQEVENMVSSGLTAVQIYDSYKKIYGEQILAVPDGTLGQIAYATPAVLSTLATGLVVSILYRFHRRKSRLMAAQQGSVTALGPEQMALRGRVRAETLW